MTFYVGQKVVCVDTRSPPIRILTTRSIFAELREGGQYTISAIKIDMQTGILAVQVEELNLADHHWIQAKRFRPLIERSTETGMAILRKVADDAAARRKLTTGASH